MKELYVYHAFLLSGGSFASYTILFWFVILVKELYVDSMIGITNNYFSFSSKTMATLHSLTHLAKYVEDIRIHDLIHLILAVH